MPAVFLDSATKPLLVLHALLALGLAGATTHLALVSVLQLRRPPRVRLVRIYAQVVGGTFAAAFVLGLLMYPSYRYHVRGLYLDRYHPKISNLFDIKENLAAIGLPLAAALFFVGRRFEADQREVLPLLATLSVLLWGLVAAAVISGLLITNAKGM